MIEVTSRCALIQLYLLQHTKAAEYVLTGAIRWNENAGLRRDAIRSQVIDALEAQLTTGSLSPLQKFIAMNVKFRIRPRTQLEQVHPLQFAFALHPLPVNAIQQPVQSIRQRQH